MIAGNMATSSSDLYDHAFYAAQIAGSARSASVVVPHILGLFPASRSVVDVGCGTGTWLHQFRLCGVPRLFGIDGGNIEGHLQIEPSEFKCVDLSRPFELDSRFDLALSLEVAEHLPAESASDFVASMVRLSDVVVFSAAIPGQGGTAHLNERWPGYWVTIFAKHGYVYIDVLRPELWYDERVEWWYIQNILVFVDERRQDVVRGLYDKRGSNAGPIDLVHPRCWEVYRQIAERAIAAEFESGDTSQVLIASDARLRSEYTDLRAEYEDVQRSASWKVMMALRRPFAAHPGLRLFVRRVLKLLYWTVTLRLPDRVRERLRARAR